jgi:hypothetical protein
MYTDTLSFFHFYSATVWIMIWTCRLSKCELNRRKSCLKGQFWNIQKKKIWVIMSIYHSQAHKLMHRYFFHWNRYLKLWLKRHRQSESLKCGQWCINIETEITEEWQPPDQSSCWFFSMLNVNNLMFKRIFYKL